MKIREERYKIIFLSLLALLILSILIGVSFGSSYISIKNVYQFLSNRILNREIFSPTWKKNIEAIIWEIRVPRVLLSAITGGGLAISGVLMQCITKNPIADPYILGISSGASAGAVAVIIFGGATTGMLGITGGAFIGAIICGVIVFIIGTENGKNISTVRLILTGLAVSTIFSSITNILVYSAKNSNQVRSAVFWSMGSLGRAKWGELLIPFLALAIVFILSILLSKSLDILLLGDNTAKMVGMNIGRIKTIIILSSTILISILVALTGSIGFIGLIVPHICRYFCGSSHRKLLTLSILVGAIFLILCDTIARTIFPPRDIPIGIITSIIGGPFFLSMIGIKSFSFGGKNGRS